MALEVLQLPLTGTSTYCTAWAQQLCGSEVCLNANDVGQRYSHRAVVH